MKYDHPTIQVESPYDGCYVVTGHHPRRAFIPDAGHIVPPQECFIPPEIPAALLRLIADAKDGSAAPAPAQPDQPLLERVLLELRGSGNVQMTRLAERLQVPLAELKALDGASTGFHVARGGWVKLGRKEGEA